MTGERAAGSDVRADVLVVGGGLVGLSTALFLAEHGVRALVVEKHAGPSIHPRARGFNERTVEHFRATTAGEDIERTGAIGTNGGGVLEAETLKGEPLSWQPSQPRAREVGISPCPYVFMGQDRLEPILAKAVREHGASVRFSTEMTGFTQDETGIEAELLDRASGKTTRVRASYLVAADGVRSSVRAALGIGQTGRGSISHNISAVFAANLEPLRQERPFGFAIITHPEAPGIFVNASSKNRWIYATEARLAEKLSPGAWASLIRKAAGLPDLELEILGTFDWETAERVAERFARGRVFLAGDAAHQMTPAGGHGANTGIQDAANLAWKLALAVRGHAGRKLLETYDPERRPVAAAVAHQSTLAAYFMARNMGHVPRAFEDLARDEGAAAAQRASSDAVVFGYRYGTDSPISPSLVLNADIGRRAPHVWLQVDGTRKSAIDLFGRGFMLLAGHPSWKRATDVMTARTTFPLRARVLSGWQEAYAVDDCGAVLVRPDGVVAARWERAPRDPEVAVGAALDTMLW